MNPRAIPTSTLTLLALLMTTATGCPPANPVIPEPDICTVPDNEPIAAVDIGEATLDSVFEPWQDGQEVALVYGGQGSPMIPFRVRIQGAETGCKSMRLVMRDDADQVILDLSYALQLYPQDDGSYISDTNFAIFDSFGPPDTSAVTLELTVSGSMVTRILGIL